MLGTRGQTSIIQVQVGRKVIDVLGVGTETTCNDVIKTVLQTNRVDADPNSLQYQLVNICKTKESALCGNAKVLESIKTCEGALKLRPFEQSNPKNAIKTRATQSLQRLITLVRKNKKIKNNLSIETKDVETNCNTTIKNNLNMSSSVNSKNKCVSKNISQVLKTSNTYECKHKLVNQYVKLILKHEVDEEILVQSISNDNSTTLNLGFVDYDEISDVEEALSEVETTFSDYDNTAINITVKQNERDVFNDCIINYDDGDYTEISDCDSVFDDGSSICDHERNIKDDYSTTPKQEHIQLAFNGAGPYLHFSL